MKKFEERVAIIYSDWDGSEADFKKKKRILQKEFHPDNGGSETLCKYANELKIEDVDFFEYDNGDRTRICGLKRTINMACIRIPEGVRVICNDSFWHKEAGNAAKGPRFNVSKVIFPKSLEAIGINAFRNARMLTEVVFEHDADQEVTVYRGAFSNNDILAKFDFACKMKMEAVAWNYYNDRKYTIFDKCCFFGQWKLPFDMSRVVLFGEGAHRGEDGIWNYKEEVEIFKQ